MPPTVAASVLDPQTLSKLTGLELRARYSVDGYQAGKHRSSHHGQSVEFAEHREYAVGDDLRYVDWKVYGKTDKVYVKQFEAETNLVCNLLLDVSQSMTYQSHLAESSKFEYARNLATALAYVVLRQGDSVALTTFDDQIRETIAPSSSPAHLHKVSKSLEVSDPRGKSRLGGVLHEISSRIAHRGIVVVISDLLDDVDSLLSALGHIRHEQQELIVFHVLDPAELEFPFQHATSFRGLEAMANVEIQPRAIRKTYLAVVKEFLKEIEQGCHSRRCDYHLVTSNQPFDVVLREMLHRRSAGRS